MTKFNLKSGNTTPFKMMGSSPFKQKEMSHLIGGQQNVPWDPTIRQQIHPSQIKTGTKKAVKKGLKQTLKAGLKQGLGFLGGKVLGTAGFFLGSMGTAKATQPGTGGHGGTKTQFLKDIDKK